MRTRRTSRTCLTWLPCAAHWTCASSPWSPSCTRCFFPSVQLPHRDLHSLLKRLHTMPVSTHHSSGQVVESAVRCALDLRLKSRESELHQVLLLSR